MSRRSSWSTPGSETGSFAKSPDQGSHALAVAALIAPRAWSQVTSRASLVRVSSSGPVPSFMGTPSRRFLCGCMRRVRNLRSMSMIAGLFLLTAMNGAVASDVIYRSTLHLPSEGSRDPMPVSVTVDADGIVCVTDATSAAGHLVDGQDVHIFSTGEAATLGSPLDITVETSGGFVCTDAKPDGGRTIAKLSFYGQPIPYAPAAVADVWSPERLLVTRDGNYVTTDPTNGILAKHDARSGELLWKTDIGLALKGELVALGRPGETSDGQLLVPVPGFRQVAVFTAEGAYVTTFGTPGATLGRMAFPVGVARCPDGTIAVVDQMRHLVLLFDDQYGFISEFGSFGRGPADLYYPAAIAVSPDGLIYVAQGFEGRIQKFQIENPESGAIDGNHPRRCEAGRNERFGRSLRGGVVHAYLSR